MLFAPDYVKYEGFPGLIAEVDCMRCGTPIQNETQFLPNYRRLKIGLSNGSYVDLLLCADCKENGKVKESNFKRLRVQIVQGWIRDRKARGIGVPPRLPTKQELIDETKRLKKFYKVKLTRIE